MKEKVQGFFDRISPAISKLGSNKYLQTIMAAMMTLMGPVILGSFAVLVVVLGTMAKIPVLVSLGSTVSAVTINAMALYLVFLIAKDLVTHFMPNDSGSSAGVMALVSFLIMTPMGQIKDGKNVIQAIPMTWLSAQGMFSAIVIGLLVGRIYVFIKQRGWTIKMPAGVPPMVSGAFAALIPSIIIGLLAVLVNYGFSLTPFGNIHQMIFSVIQTPLRGIGGSLGAMIVISLLQQLLWFFGIHGTNVLLPIVTPIWMAMDMENLAAVQAGQPVPNIIGLAFFNVITWSGTALGLALLMLIAKSKRYKELGKLSTVPALFGITEPIIFGTPLVLNFDFAVPFITNNTIALLISYFVTKIGLVARFTGAQAIFGMPVGLHAAIEGHLSIIILQIVIQLVLSPILWYPWLKRADKKALLEEQQ